MNEAELDRVEQLARRFGAALFDSEPTLTTISFQYATDGLYLVTGEIRGSNQFFDFPVSRDD